MRDGGSIFDPRSARSTAALATRALPRLQNARRFSAVGSRAFCFAPFDIYLRYLFCEVLLGTPCRSQFNIRGQGLGLVALLIESFSENLVCKGGASARFDLFHPSSSIPVIIASQSLFHQFNVLIPLVPPELPVRACSTNSMF